MTYSQFAGRSVARAIGARAAYRQVIPRRDQAPVLEPRPDAEGGWEAVSLACLLRDMRPLLERAICPEGRFRIELCLGLPVVWCDPVALEGAILTLVVHTRRSLRAGGSLWLGAAPFTKSPTETGVRLQVSLANAGACASVAMQPDRLRERALDQIGLTVASLFAESISGRISLDRPSPGSLNISLWLPSQPQRDRIEPHPRPIA